MTKLINFDDLPKDIYIDEDTSNMEIPDISIERLNAIKKEKEEMGIELSSKYKSANKINCTTYDCFQGYIQEITLTSHSHLFNKAMKKVLDYRVNHHCFETGYDLIELYNNDELVDEFHMPINSFL